MRFSTAEPKAIAIVEISQISDASPYATVFALDERKGVRFRPRRVAGGRLRTRNEEFADFSERERLDVGKTRNRFVRNGNDFRFERRIEESADADSGADARLCRRLLQNFTRFDRSERERFGGAVRRDDVGVVRKDFSEFL